MLLFENYIKESTLPNSGLGLFTKEFLKKDQIIWKFNYLIDRQIPIYDVEFFPNHVQKYLKIYGYLVNIDGLKFYELSGDNDRFTNHSEEPNTYIDNTFVYASRDIQIDEEIFGNYNDFNCNLDFKQLKQI